jgi:hypothetical protein
MRPVTGVIDLALEIGEALDIRRPRVRQAAGGEDDIFRGHGLAVGRGHRPDIGAFIERGAFDAGIEPNIRAQLEPVSDMVGVFENLGLRRVTFAPVPFLLQFVGERIGILHAFDIAARAGIPVPIPGAADIAALLVNPHRQSEPPQPVQHVHPGKAGADHDDIMAFRVCLVAFAGNGLQGGHPIRAPRDSSDLLNQHSTAASKAQAAKPRLGVAYRAAYFARRNVLARDPVR